MCIELNPKKEGVSVACTVCRQTKAPVGRSAPVELRMCDWECAGYTQEPKVGWLWPGESEEDFGYPVPDAGTKIYD